MAKDQVFGDRLLNDDTLLGNHPLTDYIGREAWQAARYSPPPLTMTLTKEQEAELIREWDRYLARPSPIMIMDLEPTLGANEAAQLLRIAAHSTAKTTKDWDVFEAMCLKVLQAVGAR